MLLKRKNDEALAKGIDALKLQYGCWKIREPLTKKYFVGDYLIDHVNDNNDSDGDSDDDDDVRDDYGMVDL